MIMCKGSRFDLVPLTPRPLNGQASGARDRRHMPDWRRPLHSLASFAVATVVMTGLLTAGLKGEPAKDSGAAGAGHFDFFSTIAKGTEFQFKGEYAIPAGFFSEGSDRFEGTVSFTGVPLGEFRDHRVGNADTVMERKKALEIRPPFPGSESTDIQLVALSMRSTLPIKVHVGRESELWDVKVSLSSSHTSTGTMKITQRSAAGGVASSEMTVYPLFTFERRTDKAERRLDVGALKLSPLTLRANDFPWATKCPEGVVTVQGLSDDFCAGASGRSHAPNQVVNHCVGTRGFVYCHLVAAAHITGALKP
jgi:hypothetical protein